MLRNCSEAPSCVACSLLSSWRTPLWTASAASGSWSVSWGRCTSSSKGWEEYSHYLIQYSAGLHSVKKKPNANYQTYSPHPQIVDFKRKPPRIKSMYIDGFNEISLWVSEDEMLTMQQVKATWCYCGKLLSISSHRGDEVVWDWCRIVRDSCRHVWESEREASWGLGFQMVMVLWLDR